jgi:hypothetical protein
METREKNPAAVALGRMTSEKKALSSRRNGALNTVPGPGKAPVSLSSIECRVKAGKSAGAPCLGGDSLEGHHWSCPRGQAILRRQRDGRDVLTGQKIEAAA